MKIDALLLRDFPCFRRLASIKSGNINVVYSAQTLEEINSFSLVEELRHLVKNARDKEDTFAEKQKQQLERCLEHESKKYNPSDLCLSQLVSHYVSLD